MSRIEFLTSFGSVRLEVPPEKMYQTSSALLQKINSVEQSFSSIEAAMNKTSGYWNGSVSEQERKNFLNSKKNTDNMIKSLSVYVEELKTMASNYVQTESASETEAEGLPANILE